MAQIKLSKTGFPNIKTQKGQSTIKFKSNPVVGNVPLLKLFPVISGNNNILRVEQPGSFVNTGRYNTPFKVGYNNISFARNMRRTPSDSNPRATIVTSLLSMVGVQGKLENLQSKLAFRNGNMDYATSRKEQKLLITNPIEVFILAMINVRDISTLDIGRFEIGLDTNLITLFLSEEKYYTSSYLDENYNKTIAKYLRADINEFIDAHNVKTEVVPDEVLRQYYTNPYSLETNSVFEIIETDKNIKNKVFSNINHRLEIAE